MICNIFAAFQSITFFMFISFCHVILYADGHVHIIKAVHFSIKSQLPSINLQMSFPVFSIHVLLYYSTILPVLYLII